jgi:hypothetical protein
MTKLQDPPATMTTSVATPSKYTTSIPMVVGLRKTGKRILGYPQKKEIKGPSITDQTSITSEGACQVEAAVATEAHSHSSLCIACTMAMIPTTAQYSDIPWVQEKDGARIQPSSATIIIQGSESHKAVGSTSLPIFFVIPFALYATNSSKQSGASSGLLPILSLCHNQSPPAFTSSINNIPSASFINYLSNAKQHESAK